MKTIQIVILSLFVSLCLSARVTVGQEVNATAANNTSVNNTSINTTSVTNTADMSSTSMLNTSNSYLLIPPSLPSGTVDEAFKIIPPNFWIDLNGSPGRDYIALQASNGGYLTCDMSGNIITNTTLTPTSLWIPKFIGKNNENVVQLQNFYGGYLNVNFIDGSVNCFPRIPTVTTIFKILYTLVNGSDLNMMLMNEGFLTNYNNTFYTSSIDYTDYSQMFKPVRNFTSFTSTVTLWNNLIALSDLM